MSAFTLTIKHVDSAFPPKALSEDSPEQDVGRRYRRAFRFIARRPVTTGITVLALTTVGVVGAVAAPIPALTVYGLVKITQTGWILLSGYQSYNRFTHPENHRAVRAGGISMLATAAGLEEQCAYDQFMGHGMNRDDGFAAAAYDNSATRSFIISYLPSRLQFLRPYIGYTTLGIAGALTLGYQYITGKLTFSKFLRNPTVLFPFLAVFSGTKGDTTLSHFLRQTYNWLIAPFQIGFMVFNHPQMVLNVLGKNGPEGVIGTLFHPWLDGIRRVEGWREIKPDYIAKYKPFEPLPLGDDAGTFVYFRIKNPENPVPPKIFSVVRFDADTKAGTAIIVSIKKYEREDDTLKELSKGSGTWVFQLPKNGEGNGSTSGKKWEKRHFRRFHDAGFVINGSNNYGVIVPAIDKALTGNPELVAGLKRVADNLNLPPEAVKRAGLGNILYGSTPALREIAAE
jgi:hypothetical protein